MNSITPFHINTARRLLPRVPRIVRRCIHAFALTLTLFGNMNIVAADPPRRLPNVVLLVADDLGYGETGCQGNSQIPTPHIDSIAAAGARFTDGYVTAPFCSASRAGLLTGRYQTRFGYEFNPIGAKNEDPKAGLPPTEQTLADVLVDTGYTTGLIGKWHLGGTARYNPMRRGFDEFFGFLHEGHYFLPAPYPNATTWLRRRTLPGGGKGTWTSRDGHTIYSTHMGHTEPDYDADNPIYRNGQPVAEQQYLTDAFTRESTDFIRRNADRPFFLYLAYNAVHSPMQGASPYMKKFAHIENIQRRIFAAMLANLDDSVGEVLAEIDKAGLTDDTLVFFISDNGGPTRELTSSNLPLRGGKGTVYEGGIRVPFLAKWPQHIPRGVTYRQPVISLDIFSTVLAAAGQPVPAHLDGVDLVPFLNESATGKPHDRLYWRTGNRAALRVGNWKLTRHAKSQGDASWELFDLTKDLAESKNLATAQPDKVRQLAAEWEEMDSGMIAPLWTP